MDETEPQYSSPPSKRHRLRYSLWPLLVFALVFLVPCGWLSMRMRRAKNQQAAVAALRALDWRVCYDYETPPSDHVYVEHLTVDGLSQSDARIYAPQPPGPSWLQRLLGDDFFADVVYAEQPPDFVTDSELESPVVDIAHPSSAHVCDSGLGNIESLIHLQRLVLQGREVTDAALEHVEKLKNLKSLRLVDTALTDAGLKHLEGLNDLTLLDLTLVGVTDSGLEHIGGMENLETLAIVCTQVTDSGLVRLRGLTKLRKLWLGNPNVTEAGIMTIQDTLPTCVVTPVDWCRVGRPFSFHIPHADSPRSGAD